VFDPYEDGYQGMRWIRPTRIKAAASRARKTAQASRERRGAVAAFDCGGALDIDVLLLGKFKKQNQERAGLKTGHYKSEKEENLRVRRGEFVTLERKLQETQEKRDSSLRRLRSE